MDPRLALDTRAAGLMTLLCLVWGMQQVVLKAVANDIAPVLQIGLRSGIAAVLVGGVLFWRRERLAWDTWRPGMVAGLLFALEYLFVGQALLLTSAGHTVVLLYTAPIFAALGLHWKVPTERLSRLQWLGIALAFGGVAVTFLGKGDAEAAVRPLSLWGDLLALLGGLAMGATTVTIRMSRLSTAPAAQTLLYQLIGAAVLLLAGAFATDQNAFVATPRAVASLAFQSLIVSFASFLAWFWLLRTYLASRLGVFSFLTPVFGVALGAVLLGETLEPRFVAGTALVLLGILVVSAHARIGAAFATMRGAR
ncbi:EamA family transporter [Aromatoleum toluvorans]|uniref:EamA family transporter n=1 Tax=Aromatoleum toluvorans TaxID=92002 RepID=A0ABX1PZM7_9RHOO|nr:DMT family transporter [Aromatoleum toluvorans]NMG44100.1 EamA family transporter [Aromatoleum toluvorans]